MNDELKKALQDNNLETYIELFEKEKILSFEDLTNLDKDDFKELGIDALGDRKKLIALSQNKSSNAIVPSAENSFPANERCEPETAKQNDQSPQPMVVVTNSGGGSENAAHTGLAGVLGGIIGAVAVIVIILIILSNESWAL